MRLGLVLAVSACADDDATPGATQTGTTGSAGDSSDGTTLQGTITSDTSSSGGADDTSDSGTSTGEPPFQPPACGSGAYEWTAMLPGPGERAHDAELAAVADRHDRLSAILAGHPHGLDADMQIATDDAIARDAIDQFLDSGAWDFAATTGLEVPEVVAAFSKATGAYAGVAIAADAYRYGTLRDQGYPCEDVERAREQLLRAIEGLERAIVITGEPGLVARAYARADLPGDGQQVTTPLFDKNGDPLPAEKNNGTWRDDNSGRLPGWKWEDSCSRDQFEGWILGMGAVWEVIRLDDTIPEDVKAGLQGHARDIAMQLRTVRPSGYDLEIWDPEGRPTFHGYLHENNFEGDYVGFVNGFHALMAAGIVSALAYVAEDPEIDAYLHDELLAPPRDLTRKAKDNLLVDFGPGTNFSNYNMAFAAGWMALRYIDDAAAREDVVETLQNVYDDGGPRQPSEQGQSLFDFVYAASQARATAFGPPEGAPDDAAIARGVATLVAFPRPPGYDDAVEQCDAEEIAASSCTLADGTVVALLGTVGHNDELVADPPIPIELRPPSNYYWRSNPYAVNGGGDGSGLPGSADFRFAYWLGRFTRRP
jgi:hypothetical protein